MDKEALKYVLLQSSERPRPQALERDLSIPRNSGKVICLVGIRRAGKTFMLFNTMQRLIAKGIDRQQMIYLNLEDDRLYPVRPHEMDMILQAHGELFPETLSQKRYLFFDEIQAAPGWERYIRRIYDTENVEIFLTGSSSGLLSRDLAAALRGRSVFFDVFPLSFREFLRFKEVKYRPYSRTSESKVIHALETYVKWGGLPELALTDDAMKPLILEEYISLLFYQDILERFDIRNEAILRLLLKTCCSQPASLISVHKLYQHFKSMGFSISKDTLYQYLGYLEEAHILFTLPIYSQSARKQAQNPKKIHLIDVGLVQAYRADPDLDRGHKLENVVFLHERRIHPHLFYHRNKHEIDLIVEARPLRYINTVWSLSSPDTLRREANAMAFGAQSFPEAQGVLLYHEGAPHPGQISTPARPAWQYLLDPEARDHPGETKKVSRGKDVRGQMSEIRNA